MGSPEIDPRMDSQLIFGKGAKFSGEKESFLKIVLFPWGKKRTLIHASHHIKM